MRILPFAISLVIACLSSAAAPPPKKPMASAGGSAQGGMAKPPEVKGDPYSATVPVDASAASASAAQTNAINSGRARAWTEVSHRLVAQKDWAKLPNLDSNTLERMVRGYTVSNEKRSTTRYVGRITYVFNPNAVKHLLRIANLGMPESSGNAILLVAMSPTYSASSAWAEAIKQPKYASAQFPLVTPIGDAVDQSSLGPLRFGDASWGQVQAVAARVHAGDAVLLQAGSPESSKMTVRMRRIGPGKVVVLNDIQVPIAAGTSREKAYATAAEQAAAAVEEAWKTKGTIYTSKKSKLVAEVRITSLDQWVAMLGKLSTVPTVSDVTVIAMNTGEGRVAFSYTGSPDQLRSAAAQSDLTIADRGGSWWISAGKPSGDEAGASE